MSNLKWNPISRVLTIGLHLVHTGKVPDGLIRWIIRRLCESRLKQLERKNVESDYEYIQQFIQEIKTYPVAVLTEKANEQHYELPPEFFQLVLGRHLKYSGCYFPSPYCSLEEAERYTLNLYLERAKIESGQDILDLGCGWGSFTLFVAEKYPTCNIIANVKVIKADICEWYTKPEQFDRIVSVEMFEHMKNYPLLLEKVANWLKPQGLLFLHIFCHRLFPYHFESDGELNWMGRYFFSGGTMPSASLLLYFQEHLQVVQQWAMNGKHYAQTSEHWLLRMDNHREEIMNILQKTYQNSQEALKWFHYWRIFWMACAELFEFVRHKENMQCL
ncbi:(S)-coclaurine N-methyltransferase [Galdieria sulphuraria]|nr:(S)-coclaurine N-methyltransferase [Galdieria sulphuraria]